jgi:hypothetical protein
LKVLSPLWANRAAYAYPIAKFESYTGPVLPSPSWVGDDSICIGTGNKRFPFRVIEKIRIVGYSEARIAKPLISIKEKKVKKTEKTPCKISVSAVYCNSRMNEGASAPISKKLKGDLNMATQSGLASALYTANVNITHEDFVVEFLKVFPKQTATIAALYWQNRPRRASFGLAPVALPAIYKDSTSTKAPKVAKVAKVKSVKVSHEKSVRAINATTKAKAELNVDEIAKIKEANLERMREVSAKLKPKGKVRDFGDRVAKNDGEGVSDFDPRLAREEVNAILRDERLIEVCPKFIREDA